jgi:hypothetical protein
MATARQVVVCKPVSGYVLGVGRKLVVSAGRGYATFAEPVGTGPAAGVLDRLVCHTGRQPAVCPFIGR